MQNTDQKSPNEIATSNGYALILPAGVSKSALRNILSPDGKIVRYSASHEEVIEFFRLRGIC